MLLAAELLIAASAGSSLFASQKSQTPALSHFIMGTLCDDLGDVDEAIKEFKKALSIDNEAPQIRTNLAISLIKDNFRFTKNVLIRDTVTVGLSAAKCVITATRGAAAGRDTDNDLDLIVDLVFKIQTCA